MGAVFSGGGAVVSYDDGVQAAASGTTGTQRNEFNAAIKSVTSSTTVGAVFLYDVSADSDGGAWRKKCKGLSWFDEPTLPAGTGANQWNSATRSARSEFPAMALIVCDHDGYYGTATKTLSIYDLDDVAAPLWMQFQVETGFLFPRSGGNYNMARRIYALNGRLYCGVAASSAVTWGFFEIDFTNDSAFALYTSAAYSGPFNGTIAERNTAKTSVYTGGAGSLGPYSAGIVNDAINDVAATVLEGAEIGALGLPIPTVAVATNGGVSVIHPSGDVYDIQSSNASYRISDEIQIDKNFVYFPLDSSTANARTLQVHPIPFADSDPSISEDAVTDKYATASTSGLAVMPRYLGANTLRLAKFDGGFGVGTTSGLSLFKDNTGNRAESAVAYITSAYNTGYMVGDIRLAALSDSDATNLVGTELVTNGDGSSTTGWTGISGATPSIVSGRIRLTNGETNWGGAYQQIVTVVGKTYTISIDLTNTGTSLGAYSILQSVGGSGIVVSSTASSSTFVATTTTTVVQLQIQNSTLGITADFDNITVRLADADRSVKNNGLATTGTVTKTAVATSAELMAFSGFSASNYLSQAYDGDFDFGTGDFSVMGWVKFSSDSAAIGTIFDRSYYTSGAYSGAAIMLRVDSGNDEKLKFQITDDGWATSDSVISTSTPESGTSWNQFVVTRRGSVLGMYVNGRFEASTTIAAAVGSLSNGNAALRIGLRQGVGQPLDNGSLSLLRISATAPTPKQIADIYAAEKPLFAANAKCLLADNQVNDLAYDKTSGLLYVADDGANAGLIMRGLENVQTLKRDDDYGFSSNYPVDSIVAAGGVSAVGRVSLGAGVNLPAIDVRAELNEGESKIPDDGKLHFEGVTTNSTPTVIGNIPIAIGDKCLVKARVIGCRHDAADSGYRISADITQAFIRSEYNSNVFAEAVASKLTEIDSDAARTAGIDVDFIVSTASQTAQLRVTGSTNVPRMVWTASVEVQRISDKTYER